MWGRRGRQWTAACALALCLVASACGGGGEDPSAGADGMTEVTVGVLPLNAVAPVYLGIERGFFEQQGLKVRTQTAEGGAAIVPSVVSGDAQFGFSNTVSLLLAHAKGLPLRVIAPGEASSRTSDDDDTALMVERGAPVRSPEDLEGKTIGVNTLNNIAHLTAMAAVSKAGADASRLRFTEIPFPDMQAAVQSGRVDAGFFNEPFTTQAQDAGMRAIAHPYSDAGPDLPIAPYFTTAEYVEEHPDIVRAFAKGLRKSTEYAAAHPDAVRKIVPTYTRTPERTVAEMGLPTFSPEISSEGVEDVAALMVQHGFLEKGRPVDDLVHAPDGK
jgi:NitT/TauT family transport system substrate-binding protein